MVMSFFRTLAFMLVSIKLLWFMQLSHSFEVLYCSSGRRWTRSGSGGADSVFATYAKLRSSPSQKFKRLSPNVQKYIRMRDLKKLQEQGASYDELKSASLNGTRIGSERSYEYNQLKGTSRVATTLDQRLQAIISYKRGASSMDRATLGSSGLTRKEERELEAMMESDDYADDCDGYVGDIDADGDYEVDEEEDEEAIYEAAVLKAIEINKLDEVKRNIEIEQSVGRAKLAKLEEVENQREAASAKQTTTNIEGAISEIKSSSTSSTSSSSSNSRNSSSSSNSRYEHI